MKATWLHLSLRGLVIPWLHSGDGRVCQDEVGGPCIAWRTPEELLGCTPHSPAWLFSPHLHAKLLEELGFSSLALFSATAAAQGLPTA